MTHRGIPLKWLAGCSMLPVLRTINMEHIDLRKLNRGELTQVRRQVVRLKKMWKTGKEIEELTGVQQNRVSEIWTVYQREGDGSLEPKKRGFQKGTHLLLTPEEQAEIRETVITRRPEEFSPRLSLFPLRFCSIAFISSSLN